jgi:hypothetical protein
MLVEHERGLVRVIPEHSIGKLAQERHRVSGAKCEARVRGTGQGVNLHADPWPRLCARQPREEIPMQSIFDVQNWKEVLLQTSSELTAPLVKHVPQLIGALLMLGIGWLVSRAVEVAARRILVTLGVDRASARTGVGDVLARSGISMTLSTVISKLFFWLLLLTFALSAIEMIGLDSVVGMIEKMVAFIPRVIGACFIVVLGLVFARFIAGLAASTFSAAGFAGGARVGVLVQGGIGILVALVAMKQIGVDTEILVGPLTVVLGAAALSAGLCFALGARPIVTHILAGHFVRQSLPRDVYVQIGDRRGVVQRVGATETLLRDGDVQWSVPNGQILDQVVVR